MMHPMRILLAIVALAASAGCAAQRERPTAVRRAPEAGERFFAGLRQITFGGQNAEAYFSHDGRRLILQRTENDSSGCDQEYLVNVDGSGLRRISNGAGRNTCGYFYDGDRRVLYSSTFAHDRACPPRPDYSHGYVWALFDYDIYTSAPDGSDLRRLTSTPGYDAESVLSPDGRKIAFTSLRDGDLDIYTMNTDGTDVRRLTTTVGYDGGPFFSPDGEWIGFATEDHLMKVPAAGGPAVQVCVTSGSPLGSWGADGTNVFSVSTARAAYRVPASGGEPVLVLGPVHEVVVRLKRHVSGEAQARGDGEGLGEPGCGEVRRGDGATTPTCRRPAQIVPAGPAPAAS